MTNQGLTLRQLLEFMDELNTKMAQHPSAKANKLLTRKEVAEILNVSLPTLHDWTKNGKITGYRIGSRVLYKTSEIFGSLIQINHAHTKGVDHGN
jgi:excisionase family DNA binding protein